jgi:methionyl-tRNA formyltransferase
MTKFSIGYFGDGVWSHRALKALLDDASIRVAFVCARFDRPDSVLRAMAASAGVDFLLHEKVNSDEFLTRTGRYECDLFVSMSFNQILRRPLFDQPCLGTINCHAGKLPFYRGRNILNWVLINDENEFGITVHYVDDGIDTGDIISQSLHPITDQDDYGTLLARAHRECADLLYGAVKQLQAGTAPRVPQESIAALGSYGSMRIHGDERLSWNQPSRDVFNFVRAICKPGPEARTFLGDVELRINRTQFLAEAPAYKGIPGAVIGVSSDGFLVKTADSYIRVVEWTGIDKIRIGNRLT